MSLTDSNFEKMESVPDEVLVMILRDYLYADELVICRLISKRFRFLIDNYVNLKELIIYCYNLKRGYMVDLSHVSNEPVNYKNSIRLGATKLSLNPSFPLLFANLRALESNLCTEMTTDTLNVLNGLTKLEKLVFKHVLFTTEDDLLQPPTLSLPNLKILSLHLVKTDSDRRKEIILRRIRKWSRTTSNPVTIPKEHPKMIVSSKIEKLYITSHGCLSSIRLNHPE